MMNGEQLSQNTISEIDKRLNLNKPTPKDYAAEFVKVFLVAAAIILPVRLFLIQPFYVKGASMEPNFYENEYLIIDKLTPVFRPYQRGEVVVFRYPKTDRHYLIKRIIGLPGERVVIKDRRITVYSAEHPAGLLLDENEYQPRELRPEGLSEVISDNEYFVLGDNRPVSLDSERFGPIDKSQIIGRVLFRGLPLDRLTIIPLPRYSESLPSN